jgi:hypothetical protein
VFDNLAAPSPSSIQDSFVVGITDDVSFASLPYGPELEVLPPGITECLFWGMGSDGTVGANKEAVKIIANQEGMNVQVGRKGAGRKDFVVGWRDVAGVKEIGGRVRLFACLLTQPAYPPALSPSPFQFSPNGCLFAQANPACLPIDLILQAYFAYDAHKSGGVTVSHLRFGPQPIRAPWLVDMAHYVGVHQQQYWSK